MPAAGQVMTQCNAGAAGDRGIGSALGVIRVADRARPQAARARSRDAALSAGRSANRVGTPRRRRAADAHHGQYGGAFHEDRKSWRGRRGRGPHRANGDTANKIGTYQIAVLAREHGVPFYVAAPVSTFDLTISSASRFPSKSALRRKVTHLQECASHLMSRLRILRSMSRPRV